MSEIQEERPVILLAGLFDELNPLVRESLG